MAHKRLETSSSLAGRRAHRDSRVGPEISLKKQPQRVGDRWQIYVRVETKEKKYRRSAASRGEELGPQVMGSRPMKKKAYPAAPQKTEAEILTEKDSRPEVLWPPTGVVRKRAGSKPASPL